MAERRMLARTIIDSDDYLDLPFSAQVLYFHLSLRADDDGFIGNVKRVAKMIDCTEDDIDTLVKNGYLLAFDSGIVVIRHWNVHNYIRKDTYKKTVYDSERELIGIDEGGIYYLLSEKGAVSQTACNNAVTGPLRLRDESVTAPLQLRDESVTAASTQDSIDKDSIDKVSTDKVSTDKVSTDKERSEERYGEEREEPLTDGTGTAACPCLSEEKKPPVRHKYGEYKNVLLSDEECIKLKEEFPDDWEKRIEELSEYIESKGAKYKSHLATIRAWARKERASPIIVRQGRENNLSPFMKTLIEMRKESICQ